MPALVQWSSQKKYNCLRWKLRLSFAVMVTLGLNANYNRSIQKQGTFRSYALGEIMPASSSPPVLSARLEYQPHYENYLKIKRIYALFSPQIYWKIVYLLPPRYNKQIIRVKHLHKHSCYINSPTFLSDLNTNIRQECARRVMWQKEDAKSIWRLFLVVLLTRLSYLRIL